VLDREPPASASRAGPDGRHGVALPATSAIVRVLAHLVVRMATSHDGCATVQSCRPPQPAEAMTLVPFILVIVLAIVLKSTGMREKSVSFVVFAVLFIVMVSSGWGP
jgi:hypothetical protein